MSDYTKTQMPNGVENIEKKSGNQGSAWGSAAGGLVVGALGGWVAGKNNTYNHRGGHYGYGNVCYDGGCSENTPVNRFELKLAEENSTLKAENALLKSEKESQNFTIAYVDKMVGKVERENEKLEAQNRYLTESAIRTEERLACVNKDLATFKGQTAEQFHNVYKYVDHEIAEERNYCNHEFLHQPTATICSDSYEFKGCCGTKKSEVK